MHMRPRRRRRGSAATACASARASAGATPDLVGPPSTLTWMHTCSGANCRGPLLAQALGDLQAVHRVHPVKVLGHQARLVALDRADAVPLQRQVAQAR